MSFACVRQTARRLQTPPSFRENAAKMSRGNWTTRTYLLWGCVAAILLWLIVVMKLTRRVDLAEFQRESANFQFTAAEKMRTHCRSRSKCRRRALKTRLGAHRDSPIARRKRGDSRKQKWRRRFVSAAIRRAGERYIFSAERRRSLLDGSRGLQTSIVQIERPHILRLQYAVWTIKYGNFFSTSTIKFARTRAIRRLRLSDSGFSIR